MNKEDLFKLVSIFTGITTVDEDGVCLSCGRGWGEHYAHCSVLAMEEAIEKWSETTDLST